MKQVHLKFMVLMALSALFSACASINSVSLTPIPAQRTQMVRASAEKTIILGFNFDNDFINPLVDDLKSRCPGGVVSGILTKDEVISYVFVFTRRVTATGFCSQTATAQGKMKRRTAGEDSAVQSPETTEE